MGFCQSNRIAEPAVISMIERTLPQGKQIIPLSLAAGQRFVTPDSEPVFGWLGGTSVGAAEALALPSNLLETCATENIFYSCNLPAPTAKTEAMPQAKANSAPDGKITRRTEAAFISTSLPGGQISIVMPGGRSGLVRFRWVCVPHPSKGTCWRCFVQVRDGAWTAAGHDYVFDAGGFLVTAPGRLNLILGGHRLTLQHPEGKLTCFPCVFGRAKVTQLCADGWTKRELLSLSLHLDRSILGSFSDGTQTVIATAAPARAAAPLAA